MVVAWQKRVTASPAQHREGTGIPDVSVARLSLPSVVSAVAAIGNRVPARGHRWIATFRRGSFPLSLLTADGMQPRLFCLKRHRLLAREAELGAVPPHPVEHHADAPG